MTEVNVGDRKALQDPFVWIASRMVTCAGEKCHFPIIGFMKRKYLSLYLNRPMDIKKKYMRPMPNAGKNSCHRSAIVGFGFVPDWLKFYDQ